jgi:response regulator of citrate/malate metabolism
MENVDKIEEAAKRAEKPVTATEIAKLTGLSLATTSKYLQLLAAEDKIRTKRIGIYLVVV